MSRRVQELENELIVLRAKFKETKTLLNLAQISLDASGTDEALSRRIDKHFEAL